MTSYVARYAKKRLRLEKVERELLEALLKDAGEKELAEAAEMIRAAQIRALKEKRQKFAPSEKNLRILDQIDQDIRWWSTVSPAVIIEGYRNPTQRRKMSSAVRRAAK